MKKSSKIFGTDGIRGKTGTYPIVPETLSRVAMAAGSLFVRGDYRHRVVIGKDTRLSGYMIEPALVAGFTSVGMDVFLLGPMPTPAVAMLTRSMRADLGVMVSASHNPFYDNGIKFFTPSGVKLSDAKQTQIENLLDRPPSLAKPEAFGRVKRIENAAARYIEFAKAVIPREVSLEGIKIVLDCAHGAAYSVGPTLLWELGAEVVSIGVSPDGFNINDACGSTNPDKLCAHVLEHQADIGLALDGDADRVVMCDEKGTIINGDQLLAFIAGLWAKKGRLQGGGVVCSHFSNGALEKYLASRDLRTIRAKVGDRYVAETMRENGINVGGESSGHIVLSDFNATGDGLVSALQVLACMAETKKTASALLRCFTPYPQVCADVPVVNKGILQGERIKSLIASEQSKMSKNGGRLLVRASGTEPVVRLLAEGANLNKLNDAVKEIEYALSSARAG